MSKRILMWLDRLISGATDTIDRSRDWLKVYVALVVLGILVHYSIKIYTGHKLSENIVWQGIAPIVLALVFIYGVLDGARKIHYLNRRRLFPRLVVVISPAVSLVAVTLPLLPLSKIARAALQGAGFAWGAATLLMLLILILPATAFNPDFAHIRMFRRFTLFLEAISGIFLFLVGAQMLLFWPEPITELQLPDAFFAQIASPTQILPNILIDVIATGLIIVILAIIIILLYHELAHRWYRRNAFETLKASIKLLRQNLDYQIFGTGHQIWPKPPKTGMTSATRLQ